MQLKCNHLTIASLCFQPRFGPHYVIQTNMGMVVDYKVWSRLSRTVSMKTKILLWLIFSCLLPSKYMNIPLGLKKLSNVLGVGVGSQIWWSRDNFYRIHSAKILSFQPSFEVQVQSKVIVSLRTIFGPTFKV